MRNSFLAAIKGKATALDFVQRPLIPPLCKLRAVTLPLVGIQSQGGGYFMHSEQRSLSIYLLLTVVIVFSYISTGCSSNGARLVEAPPAYQPSPMAPQMKMPDVVPAKLTEVREAVRRVFKDAAVIDSTTSPNFLTGDFNGDASQDLAVILRPSRDKLAEMNEEYPSWLLRDPLLSNSQERPALKVDEQDVLLAIIHGYGENDWRDSQATQTFLLKNVVGSNLAVRSAKDFQSSHSGRQLPRPQGDLIQQTLRGTDVYIYYASANYSWYDPRTFKPRSNVGMVHAAR